MSSIFGIGVPKFTGTGTPDSTTRTLFYSELSPVFSEKVYKIFETPVGDSGKRTYKSRGRYATFSVMVHLHKYDTDPAGIGSLPDAASLAAILLSYEDQDVIFYPFKDGSAAGDGLGKPVKNAAGTTIYCRLIDLQFDFLEKVGSKYDIVTLTFLTNEFWSIGQLIQ